MEAPAKIYLTEEKETLLITLYAKAADSHLQNSILHDTYSDELLKQIDYDFSKFKDIGNNVIVIRAKEFDEWIKQFIKENEIITVLYLGCGLDTRINRINPPPQVNWFDLDYPEVIKLRKTFYSDSDSYHMIESSVTGFNWFAKIPSDRNTIIIAEGIFEYLEREEVKTLINELTNYFPRGQIIFDVMNSFAIKSGKEKLKATTGAVHKWAVDKISEVDDLHPKLKRVTDLPIFKSRYMRKLPFGVRFPLSILSIIPAYKNMIRLLRYNF